MEHIVQFAINIDDKAIQNRIEEYAYRDVLDKLAKNAVDSVFAYTNAYSRETMWKTLMEDALQSFLEERKDEIIDKAANMLAGHRAIVQLDEGTIIDGYLRYVPSKLRKELRGATEGICESLTVEGVYQPVIISVNAGEKHLANGVKAVNILKEMSA